MLCSFCQCKKTVTPSEEWQQDVRRHYDESRSTTGSAYRRYNTVHTKDTVPWVSAAKPPRFLVTIKKHYRIQEVPVGSVRFLLKQIAPHQHNN